MIIHTDPPNSVLAAYNLAYDQHHNIDKQRPAAKIMSMLRDCLIKNLPSTPDVMKMVAEKLILVEQLWALGDGEDHYRTFILQNCEPYGISIGVASKHDAIPIPFVVVPTLDLYLHTDEKLEEVVGRILPESCRRASCPL